MQQEVRHADDMAYSSQLASNGGCGDAGDVVFPTNPEDLAATTLVVSLQNLQMSAVGDPAINPAKQSAQYYDKEFIVNPFNAFLLEEGLWL